MSPQASNLDLNDRWRELYRCEDLLLARAVATSIAAMEFDVRLAAAPAGVQDQHFADDYANSRLGNEEFPDAGPYIVEVPDDTWPQLAEVLLEIIREQQEFDQLLQLKAQRRQTRIVVILAGAGVVEAIALWQLIDA